MSYQPSRVKNVGTLGARAVYRSACAPIVNAIPFSGMWNPNPNLKRRAKMSQNIDFGNCLEKLEYKNRIKNLKIDEKLCPCCARAMNKNRKICEFCSGEKKN
jgi:hypothetical protein